MSELAQETPERLEDKDSGKQALCFVDESAVPSALLTLNNLRSTFSTASNLCLPRGGNLQHVMPGQTLAGASASSAKLGLRSLRRAPPCQSEDASYYQHFL